VSLLRFRAPLQKISVNKRAKTKEIKNIPKPTKVNIPFSKSDVAI
jgi:hypothetical protein